MRAYGLIVYGGFLAVFVYFTGWVEGLVVPHDIDDGPSASTAVAVVVDVLLLGVFAAQHSVMARPWFKRGWTRIVPQAAERSTYVLLSTAALGLLMWQWRPLPDALWQMGPTPLRVLVYAVSFGGWALTLLSTFAIDHFDLFGLRPSRESSFVTPLLYRLVRHPLYAGFLLAFWAAPTMSWGRLLFTVVLTGHVLAAVQWEERDLIAVFGDRYRAYRSRTPMLVPRLSRQGP